jgi:hypothetical protein
MNPISVIGAFVMTFAFLAYGIGSVTLERFRIVGSVVLIFLSLGVLFESIAILMMIVGSNGSITIMNGIVGALAFLLMLVNTGWAWMVYLTGGIDSPVNIWLVNYTKTAFFLWVLAYFTGIVFLIWL